MTNEEINKKLVEYCTLPGKTIGELTAEPPSIIKHEIIKHLNFFIETYGIFPETIDIRINKRSATATMSDSSGNKIKIHKKYSKGKGD